MSDSDRLFGVSIDWTGASSSAVRRAGVPAPDATVSSTLAKIRDGLDGRGNHPADESQPVLTGDDLNWWVHRILDRYGIDGDDEWIDVYPDPDQEHEEGCAKDWYVRYGPEEDDFLFFGARCVKCGVGGIEHLGEAETPLEAATAIAWAKDN